MSVALPKGNVAHYVNAISAAAIYIALPRLGASQHATSCAGAAKVSSLALFSGSDSAAALDRSSSASASDRSSKYS